MTIQPFDVVQLRKPLEDVDDLPKSDVPYYVLAQEGLYLRGTNPLGYYIVPINSIDRLLPLGQDKKGLFWWTASKVPAHIMAQTVDFFRQVWKELKAEAEVLILFNEDEPDENERYRLFIPNQIVSGGSVDSDYTEQLEDFPPNFQLIGTAHSHCNFGAGHSSIDTDDAKTFNGLHITIGYIEREMPDFDVMVSIGGRDFGLKIQRVANIDDINGYKAPEEWMKFVDREKDKPKSTVLSGYKSPNGGTPTTGNYYNGGWGWGGRWSTEFRKNVPDALWDEKLHELSDEGFVIILDDVLDEFKELAKKRGVKFSYEIDDPWFKQYIANDDPDNKEEEDNDGKDVPVEVIAEDEDDGAELRHAIVHGRQPRIHERPLENDLLLPPTTIRRVVPHIPKRRGRRLTYRGDGD